MESITDKPGTTQIAVPDQGLDGMRIRAEIETADSAKTKRPTWAPAVELAGELLDLCRDRRCWEWDDAAVDFAVLYGYLPTVLGWIETIRGEFNPRSLRNFPMQANGAEMLRLACCLAIERGVEVCCPVHDAILICAPLRRLDNDVATARAAMAEASRLVLGGFELRTDTKTVEWPSRYMDKRGKEMWATVIELLDAIDRRRATA